MAKSSEASSKNFQFRDLRQNLFIGTASDRYAGWIRQIYSEGRYEKGITRRSHKVGDKTFNEETLPVVKGASLLLTLVKLRVIFGEFKICKIAIKT